MQLSDELGGSCRYDVPPCRTRSMDSATSRFKLWTGTLLLVPSLFMWFLWINSFKAGTTQVARQAAFLSHFPDGTTLSLLSVVALLTSVAAIALGGIALKHSTLFLR